MAFTPLNYDEGKLVDLPMSAGGSTATYAIGQALKISSGYYVVATAGQNTDITHVCMEAGTITADGQTLKAIRTLGTVFLADTDGTPTVASYQGTYADLASASTVDEDASTDDLFYIEQVVLPTSKKQVIGWFSRGVPNS